MPITLDVFTALLYARLNASESLLVGLVIRETYGTRHASTKIDGKYPDPIPAKISFRELARKHGLSRTRLHKAKTALVESRILTETAEGLILNKDASQWLDAAGAPRLTESMLAECTARVVPKTVPGGTENGTRVVPETVPGGTENGTRVVPETVPLEVKVVPKTVPGGTENGTPPNNPLIGIRDLETLSLSSRACERAHEGQDYTPANLDAYLATLPDDEAWRPIKHLAANLAMSGCTVHLEWIELAIRAGKIAPGQVKPQSYYAAMFAGWARNPSTVPSVVTQRVAADQGEQRQSATAKQTLGERTRAKLMAYYGMEETS